MAAIKITSGKQEYTSKAATMLAPCFQTDPVITYQICSLSPKRRKEYLPELFETFASMSSLHGGTFYEANDWASSAILMHPGQTLGNPINLLRAGVLRVLWNVGISNTYMGAEYMFLAEQGKNRHLKGEQYYYIFFVATEADQRGKGLSSKVLQSIQELARKTGHPIWVEASTATSQRLYAKQGFKTVENFILGAGKAGPDGELKKDGEGVPFYGMLWRPTENVET